ncbi:type II toxin-antitoxin system VapC family toxin [Methylobacterium hispanicum]|uniref:type II toxin-antitoxin system VapC family toxin n=1 Tax=Methylobacterium hispanicum TaxID=270350 RepID=UPI002F34C866
MIVLDSSAIVAIMLEEEEEEAFSEILGSNPAFVGAPTLVETRLVVDARLPAAGDLLNKFLHDSAVTIVPFDAAMFVAAADAFTRYGRGRHRARLNFGDCLSYAVASVMRLPLLFKGDDFVHTDIVPAYSPAP